MPILRTEIPLPASPPARFTGMAYDGAHFYLAKECGNEVCRYDCQFEPECCYETCRNYASLCYDPAECCFWASSDSCRGVLFRLTPCFQEIDCIPAADPGCRGELGIITGVSYDCGCDRLIAAYPSGLVSVSKRRKEDNFQLAASDGAWILGVLSVCPYLACCCMICGKQVIRVYSLLGELLEEYELSCADTVRAAVFLPCRGCCESLHLAVLTTRHGCYSYVWDCLVPCCVLAEPVCSCNSRLCAPVPDCCEAPCRCEIPCRCEPCRGCSDLLDCTAQLEKAVACVLFAEGDKLKKVLAASEDPAELLAANRSVQATIVQAAHLEQLLFDLLSEFQEAGEL